MSSTSASREDDFTTRCKGSLYGCNAPRYLDVNNEGRWTLDGWMCGGCVGLMDGHYRQIRYDVTPEFVNLLSTRWH
jgi:hypothetical protein